MNRELIVNVNPTEISIALCEDKVLVELNKEQCQTGFAVGDIYLGKVRKIMPGVSFPRSRSSSLRSSPANGACASRA